MEHVAIMKRSWGLTRKVISGEKTVESRWYASKRPPWGRIARGDAVYFKDSGEPVTAMARVSKVVQFSDLTREKVREILKMYGREAGIGGRDLPGFVEAFGGKRYCILVFLENAQEVAPFGVDKRGYGIMSAWITLDDVGKIRI